MMDGRLKRRKNFNSFKQDYIRSEAIDFVLKNRESMVLLYYVNLFYVFRTNEKVEIEN